MGATFFWFNLTVNPIISGNWRQAYISHKTKMVSMVCRFAEKIQNHKGINRTIKTDVVKKEIKVALTGMVALYCSVLIEYTFQGTS